MANPKVYIHEFIDIRGHHRADYMHHMTANWSPTAQRTRSQQCFGVWAVLGSTGAWPQVVNLWEEDGLAGLAASFAGEAVGPGAQDETLATWWAKAAEFRRGGFDRLLRPAAVEPRPSTSCAPPASGATCYAHELVKVRPGAAAEFLDLVRHEAVALHRAEGLELVGAFSTLMVDDDECLLLWAVPTWAEWAGYETALLGDGALAAWVRRLPPAGHGPAPHPAGRQPALAAADRPPALRRRPHRLDGVTWPPRSPTRGSPPCGPASASPNPIPSPRTTACPNEDAFRHVAEAYGDDNPLWCDPAYGADHPLGRADRPAAPGRRRHAHRRGRGHAARRRDQGADEGRPARRRPRLLLGQLPRVVGPLRPGTPVAAAQRAGRRARQGRRVRRAGRARVDRPRCSPRPTVRSCPAQYRLMIRTERDEGRGAQASTTTIEIEPVHRRARSTRIDEAVRRRARPPPRRRAPLVGGRRARATSSARW